MDTQGLSDSGLDLEALSKTTNNVHATKWEMTPIETMKISSGVQTQVSKKPCLFHGQERADHDAVDRLITVTKLARVTIVDRPLRYFL
jgi:hypothetical protein